MRSRPFSLCIIIYSNTSHTHLRISPHFPALHSRSWNTLTFLSCYVIQFHYHISLSLSTTTSFKVPPWYVRKCTCWIQWVIILCYFLAMHLSAKQFCNVLLSLGSQWVLNLLSALTRKEQYCYISILNIFMLAGIPRWPYSIFICFS